MENNTDSAIIMHQQTIHAHILMPTLSFTDNFVPDYIAALVHEQRM